MSKGEKGAGPISGGAGVFPRVAVFNSAGGVAFQGDDDFLLVDQVHGDCADCGGNENHSQDTGNPNL